MAAPEIADIANPSSTPLRVLVFVIAHRAQATLARVLDEIPREVALRYRLHILVIDDASSDDTFGAGSRWAAGRGDRDVSVLQNPRPSGYGGNRQINYGKEGILDFTHTRLLKLGTLRDLLEQIGYEVLEARGVPAPFPKALGDHAFSRALVRMNELAIHVSRRVFAYQVFLRVRPRPTVQSLLAATRRHSEAERRARGFAASDTRAG